MSRYRIPNPFLNSLPKDGKYDRTIFVEHYSFYRAIKSQSDDDDDIPTLKSPIK